MPSYVVNVALASPPVGNVLVPAPGTTVTFQMGTLVTGTGGGNSLATTAVKTANYTAGANEIVPMDATAAARTVTLPTAPADRTQVIVKKIDTSGNAVTLACGGSDVFNKTGGSTSLTLPYLNRSIAVQYDSSRSVWTVIANDLAMPALPVIKCFESAGTYVRQNYAGPVQFEGADAPAIRTDGVTTGGDNQAVQGLDSWAITP